MLQTTPKRGLLPCLALSGLISGILGLYVTKSNNLSFSVMEALPGAIFGLTVSACLVLFGFSFELWKLIALPMVCASASVLATLSSMNTEMALHSAGDDPFANPWRGMFVGGTVGGIIVLGAFLWMADTTPKFKQWFSMALKFCFIGGILGVAGLLLSPTLGGTIYKMMQLVEERGDIYLNEHGSGIWAYSILPVWQVGMSITLGLLLRAKRAV